MVFDTLEKSIEDGQPVELYEFTLGVEKTRYTSAEDVVNFASFDWQPRSISRSSTDSRSEGEENPLNVTLPANDTLAQLFLGVRQGQVLALRIWRFHRGDTEGYVLWDGVITSAGFKTEAAECVMEGFSNDVAFSRSIGRAKYLSLCNHVLYGEGCGVVASAFDYDGNVSVVSGKTITVDGLFAAKGADWAVGGYVSFSDTDFRLVLAQSGDVLTLLFPFANTPLSSTVKVFAGCDRTATTCDTKFSNVINFGGFPYVPGFNIFQTGMN